MIPQEQRVSVALAPGAEKEEVLAAMEEALGRRPELVVYVRGARVLSLLLRPNELELVRQIPGVRQARTERRVELPPRPMQPKARE